MDPREVFKTKAIELASKLQQIFPARLSLLIPSLHSASEDELMGNYIRHIHRPFSARIKDRDEEFFMTTSDVDDPMNLVAVLRHFWQDLPDNDKDIVWRYMAIFERLAACDSKNTASR